MVLAPTRHPRNGFSREFENCQGESQLNPKRDFGYSFMLRSPNQRANQIRRSYKNEEFDWLFDFVTV